MFTVLLGAGVEAATAGCVRIVDFGFVLAPLSPPLARPDVSEPAMLGPDISIPAMVRSPRSPPGFITFPGLEASVAGPNGVMMVFA